MVFRIVIDVMRCKQFKHLAVDFVDKEACDEYGNLAERPVLLRLKTNRFLPADFVFRCKVVAAR